MRMMSDYACSIGIYIPKLSDSGRTYDEKAAASSSFPRATSHNVAYASKADFTSQLREYDFPRM